MPAWTAVVIGIVLVVLAALVLAAEARARRRPRPPLPSPWARLGAAARHRSDFPDLHHLPDQLTGLDRSLDISDHVRRRGRTAWRLHQQLEARRNESDD